MSSSREAEITKTIADINPNNQKQSFSQVMRVIEKCSADLSENKIEPNNPVFLKIQNNAYGKLISKVMSRLAFMNVDEQKTILQELAGAQSLLIFSKCPLPGARTLSTQIDTQMRLVSKIATVPQFDPRSGEVTRVRSPSALAFAASPSSSPRLWSSSPPPTTPTSSSSSSGSVSPVSPGSPGSPESPGSSGSVSPTSKQELGLTQNLDDEAVRKNTAFF